MTLFHPLREGAKTSAECISMAEDIIEERRRIDAAAKDAEEIKSEYLNKMLSMQESFRGQLRRVIKDCETERARKGCRSEIGPKAKRRGSGVKRSALLAGKLLQEMHPIEAMLGVGRTQKESVVSVSSNVNDLLKLYAKQLSSIRDRLGSSKGRRELN